MALIKFLKIPLTLVGITGNFHLKILQDAGTLCENSANFGFKKGEEGFYKVPVTSDQENLGRGGGSGENSTDSDDPGGDYTKYLIMMKIP